MKDEELTGLLLRVLGALPNGDDLKIAKAVEVETREQCAAKCDAAYYATKHSVPIHGFATALNAGVHDGRLDMAEELAAAIRGGK